MLLGAVFTNHKHVLKSVKIIVKNTFKSTNLDDIKNTFKKYKIKYLFNFE